MSRNSKSKDSFAESCKPIIDPEDGVARPFVPEDFDPTPLYQLKQELDVQVRSFSELLDTLTMDTRLKFLWKQVYDNAVNDRKNAMMAWSDLYFQVHGKSDQHAIHGDRIAKYMERMEKSNQQLLKLAELVYKVKEQDEDNSVPTGNALFDVMEGKKKN